MKKKIALILSVIALGSTLAGCSPSENSSNSESTTSSPNSELSSDEMSEIKSTESPTSSYPQASSDNTNESSLSTSPSENSLSNPLFPSETSEVSQTPFTNSAASSEPTDFPVKTENVSEMLFNDELITDVAVRDLVDGYDYILDVAFVVDETRPEIQIAIQVPLGTDAETVEKAGDKAARYLASLANYVNSDFALPCVDDLGGLFEKYNLLLYIDDGYGGIDKYGAKVTFSPVITW